LITWDHRWPIAEDVSSCLRRRCALRIELLDISCGKSDANSDMPKRPLRQAEDRSRFVIEVQPVFREAGRDDVWDHV
jgi:hypothetical protein